MRPVIHLLRLSRTKQCWTVCGLPRRVNQRASLDGGGNCKGCIKLRRAARGRLGMIQRRYGTRGLIPSGRWHTVHDEVVMYGASARRGAMIHSMIERTWREQHTPQITGTAEVGMDWSQMERLLDNPQVRAYMNLLPSTPRMPSRPLPVASQLR